MDDLIARLEAATEGSRELDAAIYYGVLRKCRHEHLKESGAQSDTGFDCLHCGADSWGNLGRYGQRLHDQHPHYTTSIDAALTLVPEKCAFSISFVLKANVWIAKYRIEAIAPTIPLAICIAALKARANAD